MRKKAFIFSIDAMFAVIALFTALASLSLLHNDSSLAIQQNTDLNASDAAIVALYLGKTPAYFGLTESTDPNAMFSSCETVIKYIPASDTFTNTYFCASEGRVS